MAIDKNAIIKEAQKFAAKGQYDKAVAEWKKLIKESPNDANLYNTIGDLCLKKKKGQAEAVDAYKKAADILAQDGFTSKAIALYKKVLNIDPGKMEVHLALGDLNAEKGLVSNALESYKLVADHYTQQKETAKALGIYQKMADLNPANITFRLKLADMYAKEGMKKEASKAYLAAAGVHMGNNAFQEARQVFEKVLALDPGNKEVYYKAGIVYSREGKYVEACKAFKPAFENDPQNEELADLYIEALTKAGRSADAEEVYRKLLSLDAKRLDLREKLYRLHLTTKEYEKAFAEAQALADVRMEDREFDAALELLKGFVAESPGHADARRKLGELYEILGKRNEAAREFLKAAELLVPMGDREGAKDALARALHIVPDMPEARRRLESLEAPEVSAPAEEAGPAPPRAVAAIEEDPAITEAFTEVDVLVKYGMTGKAMEQLENLAGRFPESSQVRLKLRDMYIEQGNAPKAVEHSLVLADLYQQQGLEEQRNSVLQAALDMDPENGAIRSLLGMAPAAPAEEAPPAPAPAAEEPAFQEPAFPAPVSEAAPEPAPPEDLQLSGEDLTLSDWTPPAAEGGERPSAIAEEPAAAVQGQEPPAAEVVEVTEIWAEAEFYYQQGLFDEAKKYYEKILEHTPNDGRARERIEELSREKEEVQEFTKLAEAVEGLESLVPAETPEGELAPSTSDEEAVRVLMQEIEQLKQKQGPVSAPPPTRGPAAPHAPREVTAQPDFTGLENGAEIMPPAREEKEPSEDFFDLAAELRDELSAVTLPSKPLESAEEQSLEDIFTEFKKGVEEQAGKEDADTHYNLGIAYKEMGLLDDAVAEFLMTPEGEDKFIQSRYMLGLCYLEKGDYQVAITELQNALGYSYSLGQASQERIGMHYDLGLAYQGVGNTTGALEEFQKVYNLDPGYREVATKLEELKQGEFISLDQIKEDIEKEISAKFLEEGERIEREEKTRKSDKVRS